MKFHHISVHAVCMLQPASGRQFDGMNFKTLWNLNAIRTQPQRIWQCIRAFFANSHANDLSIYFHLLSFVALLQL